MVSGEHYFYRRYGLDEKIGNISYYDSTNQGYGFTKPYSEETAKIIDQEIKQIIEKQYERAKNILSKNREKLDLLAEKLIESEVIFKEDLVKIFGERPFPEKGISLNGTFKENPKKSKTISENSSTLKKDVAPKKSDNAKS